MEKIALIMNRTSGTVLRLGEDRVLSLIDTHMKDKISDVHLLDGDAIPDMIENIAASKPPGIMVGGGDGTAVFAADLLAEHKIPFGILPLGTMNMLAQDLGSAATFEETVERFGTLSEDVIDAGFVNDKMFLCSAVIGFVPEGAVVREELRENITFENVTKFLGTIARGMTGEDKQKLKLRSKSEDVPYELTTTSLIVSNNRFVKTPSNGAERFLRETLTEGKLAAYSAAPKDMFDGLKIAYGMWNGDWQEQDSIMSFETPDMIVETEKQTALVSLDGEPLEMQSPLQFRIKPRSVPVLRMQLRAAEEASEGLPA